MNFRQSVKYPPWVDTFINKSVNPRGVFYIVISLIIEKLKLLHDYQKSDYGLTVYSDYHGVRPATMSKWIKQFSGSIKLEIFLNYINGLSVTIMTNFELIRQRESESKKWDEK